MGIDFIGLRALSFANRVYKFNFQNTVTLGRHEIHYWHQEFGAIAKNFDFECDETIKLGEFCEALLSKLGAKNITSIDASAFEGASVVHDFNLPIPENLRAQFDTFLDFGSIEHVFNVAQVVDNIVKLVKPGGSVLIVTNTNGFPAHGFFQFSPEFFYSVFSERNGFQDTSVLLVKTTHQKMWNLIKRPTSLRRRNDVPFEDQLMAVVYSRKAKDVDRLTVIQSDYDQTWSSSESGSWEGWNRTNIPRSKKILHSLINPYLFRRISNLHLSNTTRRKYADNRVPIDPDTVDPSNFMQTIKG